MTYLTKHQERIWASGKSCRDLRYNDFVDIWIYDFGEVCKVFEHTNDSFTLEMDGMGTVDFYPKSNKVLIRKDNKWINQGLQWLIEKLLK